jgi:hypothetical protein
MDTLFAYVDGSDLEECHPALAPQLEALANVWADRGARFIDDRFQATPDLSRGDLPDWNLGLNVPLGQLTSADAAQLVETLRRLSADSGRDFVVGLSTDDGRSEDIVFVGSQAGDRETAQILLHANGP